jgi:hypothetical protein
MLSRSCTMTFLSLPSRRSPLHNLPFLTSNHPPKQIQKREHWKMASRNHPIVLCLPSPHSTPQLQAHLGYASPLHHLNLPRQTQSPTSSSNSSTTSHRLFVPASQKNHHTPFNASPNSFSPRQNTTKLYLRGYGLSTASSPSLAPQTSFLSHTPSLSPAL